MAVNEPTATVHPDVLMARFSEVINSTADIDPYEVLWDILADARGSMRLAMESAGLSSEAIHEVDATVADYLVNNYGDERGTTVTEFMGAAQRFAEALDDSLGGVALTLAPSESASFEAQDRYDEARERYDDIRGHERDFLPDSAEIVPPDDDASVTAWNLNGTLVEIWYKASRKRHIVERTH